MSKIITKPAIRKCHSPKSAAEQLDASVSFVRNEIRAGNLRAKKVRNDKVVILDADLQDYLESLPDWKSSG